MTPIEIRDARGAELTAGCALLARSLGFTDRDALPPWLVQTAADHGGIALVAVSGGTVVGFSAAIAAGGDRVFSCGLAVTEACRGQGVGRRLKLAQRERAREQGCSSIRWTADPLSAAALTLYLPGLGAHLIGYGEALYADVRPAAVPPDDVVIDWPLTPRRGTHAPAARVEIPFAHAALPEADLRAWRLRVRRAMQRALGAGAIGTGTAIDRGARRAWVLFSERAA